MPIIVSGAFGETIVSGSGAEMKKSNIDSITYGSASIDAVGGAATIFTGAVTGSAGFLVPDDKNLYFGTGEDAYIKYRETGDDRLTISGSANGIAISGSSVDIDGNLTVSGSSIFAQDVLIKDNQELYFGDANDASIRYNEAGDDHLVVSGSSATVVSGNLLRVENKLAVGLETATSKASGLLVVSAHADDTTNGLIATFKSGDSDYGRVNIDNTTANGDTQFTFMSNGSSKWSVGNMGSNETLHIKPGFGDFADSDPFVLTLTNLTLNTALTASSGALIKDDKNLYFGNGEDAIIYYRETGDDRLTISGSAIGVAISGSEVDIDGNLTVSGSSIFTALVSASANVSASAFYGSGANLTNIASAGVAAVATTVTITDNESTNEDNAIIFTAGGDVDGGNLGLEADGDLTYNPSTGLVKATLVSASSNISASAFYGDGANLTNTPGTVTAINNRSANRLVTLGSTTTELDGEANLTYDGTTFVINDDAKVNDDFPLYFGSNNDAYIKYRETGDDRLTISGSANGIAISGSSIDIDAQHQFTVSGSSVLGNTMSKRTTVISMLTASQGALIKDDKKLYFGDGEDASIEYDENGTDELRFAGAAVTFEQDVTFDNDVVLGVTQGDTATATGRLTASQGVLIKDDKKLYFGNGEDASFEYDEDGTDRLLYAGASMRISDDVKIEFGTAGESFIYYRETTDDRLTISGSANGVAISGSSIDLDCQHRFTVSGSSILGKQMYDTTTATGPLTASRGVLVKDDQKLYFGDGQDASFEYDENGTDTLLYAGSSLRISDDTKLQFGTGGESYIQYRENNDDYLDVSGSAKGIVLSGSTIVVDGNIQSISGSSGTGKLSIGTGSSHTAFTSVNDYSVSGSMSFLNDGEGGGTILRYSPGANDTDRTVGQLYYLHSDGTWDATDADNGYLTGSGAAQLLGVALGPSSRTDGYLLRGFVRIPATEILNVSGSGINDGRPLYVSTTAGHFDLVPPNGSGDFVRIVGYAVDDNGADVLIYFDPDKTWIKVA